jgi:hypothetical protein
MTAKLKVAQVYQKIITFCTATVINTLKNMEL